MRHGTIGRVEMFLFHRLFQSSAVEAYDLPACKLFPLPSCVA